MIVAGKGAGVRPGAFRRLDAAYHPERDAARARGVGRLAKDRGAASRDVGRVELALAELDDRVGRDAAPCGLHVLTGDHVAGGSDGECGAKRGTGPGGTRSRGRGGILTPGGREGPHHHHRGHQEEGDRFPAPHAAPPAWILPVRDEGPRDAARDDTTGTDRSSTRRGSGGADPHEAPVLPSRFRRHLLSCRSSSRAITTRWIWFVPS